MAPRRRSTFKIRRVYDDHLEDDKNRVLVDRLWPRGIRKAGAPIDEWVKDVAPSADLRRWYGHEPAKFEEFARRYESELKHAPAKEAVTRLRAAARNKPVTLVTATRDVDHSGAAVLLRVLSRA
jgi:uncharacterized protein YeaO (DUF488 family)